MSFGNQKEYYATLDICDSLRRFPSLPVSLWVGVDRLSIRGIRRARLPGIACNKSAGCRAYHIVHSVLLTLNFQFARYIRNVLQFLEQLSLPNVTSEDATAMPVYPLGV